MDTCGVLFNSTFQALGKIGIPSEIVMGLISLIGAALYRLVQKQVIQRLPLKWKWVNNRLTMGILTKIFSAIFGKTSVLFNAKIDGGEKAKQALAEETVKYVSKKVNPEIKQAFDDAIGK